MDVNESLRIGRVTFEIRTETGMGEAVASAVQLPRAGSRETPKAVFEFPKRLPRLAPDVVELSGHLLRVQVHGDAARTTLRAVAVPTRLHRWLPRSVFRTAYPGYLSQDEHLAGAFLYQGFDGILQDINLRVGQSFIHAAALEKDGQRVLVVAGGGMGKTGSLIRLVSDHGWRYLSDDWTVLEEDGSLGRSHKPVQVAPRNLSRVSGGDQLLLGSRPFLDRSAWNIRRRLGRTHGLSRKVSAASLFGKDGLGSPGPVTLGILIRREDVPSITGSSVGVEEFSEATAAITTRELAPSIELLAPWRESRSIGGDTSRDLEAAAASVVQRAMTGRTLRKVAVPRTLSEPQIEDHLVDMLTEGA